MIDIDLWRSIKGFMDEAEAMHLFELCLESALKGPVLEIGSYCGKSAIILGTACKHRDSILFTVDHHRGSEEQQPGEAYFDPDLYDDAVKGVNTLPFLLKTLEKADLLDAVVPVVATSRTTGKCWKTPLSMVFIDGGHSFEAAVTDYQTWQDHIIPGGLLVIHDIFPDPSQGGQAPRQVYEMALESGKYKPLRMVKTLGVLEKIC